MFRNVVLCIKCIIGSQAEGVYNKKRLTLDKPEAAGNQMSLFLDLNLGQSAIMLDFAEKNTTR